MVAWTAESDIAGGAANVGRSTARTWGEDLVAASWLLLVAARPRRSAGFALAVGMADPLASGSGRTADGGIAWKCMSYSGAWRMSPQVLAASAEGSATRQEALVIWVVRAPQSAVSGSAKSVHVAGLTVMPATYRRRAARRPRDPVCRDGSYRPHLASRVVCQPVSRREPR